MILMAWNVRGINTPYRMGDVLTLLTKFKPTFVGLLEIKLIKRT